MKEPFINRILPAATLFIVAIGMLAYMDAFDGFMVSHRLTTLLTDTGDLLLIFQGSMVLMALWIGIKNYVKAY